jgi:hypothetical protein
MKYLTQPCNGQSFCLDQSINQFTSFPINPLQGVFHMDIEMVNIHNAGYTNNIYNKNVNTLILRIVTV